MPSHDDPTRPCSAETDPHARSPRIPRPRGRPTKLTEEVHQAIVGLLRRGATLRDAALSQGVAEATVFEWVARGECTDPERAAEPRYQAFAHDVRQGAASARVVASTRLFDQNSGRWLAQVDPASWGPGGTAHQEPEPPSLPTHPDEHAKEEPR